MPENVRPILIVDDDQDDVAMLTEALLAADPTVHILTASSGKEALSLLQAGAATQVPKLVILDYNMPDMTGPEVLHVLHSEEWFSTVTKAVWSTSDAALYEQQCRQAGADYYFKKPDNIDAVWALAGNLLSL